MATQHPWTKPAAIAIPNDGYFKLDRCLRRNATAVEGTTELP